MSIITASVLGLAAVLLAVQFKSKGGEYGTYLIMAAGLILFFYGTGKTVSYTHLTLPTILRV